MTRLLEGIAAALLLAMWAAVVIHWDELPERYPTHFGVTGQPDAWGSRQAILLLPAIGSGLYLLLTVITYRVRRFNVPFPVDQDDPRVRAALQQMLTSVKAGVMALLAYIHIRSMAVAVGRADGLGTGLLPAIAIGTPTLVFFYLWRLSRFRRAE